MLYVSSQKQLALVGAWVVGLVENITISSLQIKLEVRLSLTLFWQRLNITLNITSVFTSFCYLSRILIFMSVLGQHLELWCRLIIRPDVTKQAILNIVSRLCARME